MGLKFAHCRKYTTLTVTPVCQGPAGSEKKQLDEACLTASFVDSSCSFSVHEMHPIRNFFMWG